RFDEQDMLRIQLDDEARFLDRWRQLLLDLLDEHAHRPLRDVLAHWEGRAAVDARAYRVVHEFREQVRERVFGAYAGAVIERQPDFTFAVFPQSEAPLWRLVTQQPPHLLPPGHDSWSALLRAAVDDVQAELTAQANYAWGAYNTVQ